MEGRISTFTLLCLVLSGVGALQVTIPDKLPGEVYEFARGDNITLPCEFVPKEKISKDTLVIITWNSGVSNDESRVASYYSNEKKTYVTNEYEGRASLDVDIPKGKADLKLSKITGADDKLFECKVTIPGDNEGRLGDTVNLVVLVAPSTPICKIQGKAEYGQNINLTCKSEEGTPTPSYEWKSRDVRNMPRAAPPGTTDKGGVLSLYNISKDASGYYICTSSNKIRSATCNLTLAVMPPSMNIGSTAGIIGGVVAALIALIIIIYCCCCRKKKKEEEYAMGVREDEYSDKEPARNGESRRPDGQEEPRDYDDSSVRRPGDRSDHYEERDERYDDRRSDYDDRRDYEDRRSNYDDRRDYEDRRSNYDDRRDYEDRRSDNEDRRSDYTDRRDRYRDHYEDDRDYERRNEDERRYDDRRDRRYDDDRYDEPYDDRNRDAPPVPANKPARKDYDD